MTDHVGGKTAGASGPAGFKGGSCHPSEVLRIEESRGRIAVGFVDCYKAKRALTMDLPLYLTQQISDGKAVLVLGAGASVGAAHPKGLNPPTALQLARSISNRFLGGEFETSPLSTIAELAISESNLRTVQEFIKGVFEPFTPAPFHLALPTFKWHGLATTNYDLVIERAYTKSPLQKLRPILSNRDRIEDFLRNPSDLLYLKLHGCITRDAEVEVPLILTPDQYVTHKNGRTNLFDILAGWARERTLVFVGTALQDFDLRMVLLEIARDEPSRSRFYLVTPDAPDALKRFWESKKITVLEGTFAQFVDCLNETITGIARAVPTPAVALPIFAKFSHSDPALSEPTRLCLEHDLDYVHSGLDSPVVDPKTFYRGFSYGWSAIQQNLDCHRELTDQVLLDVFLNEHLDRPADIVLIRAEAGAGKSVLLRRLAWEAASQLKTLCLFATQGTGLTPEALSELADRVDERIFLFVDDAADRPSELERLLRLGRKQQIPLTVVVAERSNEWNVFCSELTSFISEEYELEYLRDPEIVALLELLNEHRALGTLDGQSRESQESAFRKQAGRQLLVALHEATLGGHFEDIIWDEYRSLMPEAAQQMYLTICTLNRTGTPVRAGLVSRVHGITFEQFSESFFAPLDKVVFADLGRRRYDYEYRARHPHIADMVFQRALPKPRDRYEKYATILSGLNVSFETDRRSFREMINARKLREVMNDAQMVERLYNLARERAPEDGHVYLQHGLYEMKREGGSLDKTADLLAKARERLPESDVVAHTFAELEFERGERAQSAPIREAHLKKAKGLASSLVGKNAKRAHGYHTLFKVEHLRLKRLLEDPSRTTDQAVADAVRNVESALTDGLQRFPSDPYLLTGESELAHTLDDNDRGFLALERVVGVNPHSAPSVARLAKVYIARGERDKARILLERSIDTSPFEKRLHYAFARLLMQENADGLKIEKHLRSAFSEGDGNLEAQFWYARQLYVNDKIAEASQRFEKLSEERVDPDFRQLVQAPWMREE